MRLQSPGGPDAEVFRNRKGYFSINTQVVGNNNLKIMDIVARWPGSAHGQTIFNSSRIKARFQNTEFGDNVLLGDSGYANQNYFLTTLLNPATQSQQLYNESDIRTLNVVERLFGVWKRRFPVLAIGMRYRPELANNILAATGILHNVAIENGKNVPPPPEGIDEAQLNYLIEMGNIDPGPLHESVGNQN
nr:unnamed protein product [Callosobruchus analis]